MGGTRLGGLKAKKKILARDPDYFKKIGAKGGHMSKGGKFATDRKFAAEMGRRGGTASRRTVDESLLQWPCEYCPKMLASKDSRNSHIYRMHSEEHAQSAART